MPLPDFPDGQTIFLDANCLIYHFTGTYPSCAILLDRARQRNIRIVTSTAIIAEVHHRLMMLEMAKRVDRPLRLMPSCLKQHPEIIRSLRECERAIDALPAFRLRVVPVTWRLFDEARRLSHELGLLTNDGLVVATMRAHHITHLASNDTDFARVPGITVWRP